MTCDCPNCRYDRWLAAQLKSNAEYALKMATAAQDPERIARARAFLATPATP